MELGNLFHATAALPSGKNLITIEEQASSAPGVGLDALDKRKTPRPFWDTNSGPSSS
jgi:hypothetical protein